MLQLRRSRTSPLRRRAFTTAGLALAAASLVLVGPVSAAVGYEAQVTRTPGGVAHIKADNLGNGGYGVGFAAAQDNICTLADSYLTTSGQRSRYLGSAGGNLASDYFWQSTIDDGTVEHMLGLGYPQGPSDEAKAMAAGYAAGYNNYLESIGGRDGITDPRCAGAAWVRPLEAIDVWRLAHQLAMRASSMQFVSALAAAAPPAAPVAARSALTSQDVAENLAGTMFDPAAEPTLGSNALGIGRDASASGTGLTLANPHFPWRGNERFWEFHLQVEGDLNVIGASLMGAPVVNIGHNENVAWSHTVSTGRRFTLASLKLAAGNPTSYIVDGSPLAMRKQTVTVKVRQADGTLTDSQHDWYFTRYGRVTTFPQLGLGWSSTSAVALQDANASNLRLFDQWLEIDRAKSAQDVIDAEKRVQGIPWVNTIGSDDKGNAFYTDLAVVPNLPASKINSDCIPPGIGQVAKANRLYLLDGSRTACDLGTDADAVEPGIFGASNMPYTMRTDYVQNSNDSYWLTNPGAPLTGFSPVIGTENNEQGLRTRLGIDIVQKRLNATDGLSTQPKFNLDTLKRSWTGYRNLGAELTLPGLRAICHANPTITVSGTPVNVSAACPVLDAYDGTGKRDSAGGWLFARWIANAPSTSASFWTVPFSLANPVGTPNTLNTALAANKTALGQAVQNLQARGIPLDATWGDVQKSTRGDERIPIPGCNTGCYPVTAVSTSPASYGEVGSGSSFVMFAEMGPKGPKAEALLTYSQSEDSTSPFYADQTRRYSNDDWISLPFKQSDIVAQRISKTNLPAKAPKNK